MPYFFQSPSTHLIFYLSVVLWALPELISTLPQHARVGRRSINALRDRGSYPFIVATMGGGALLACVLAFRLPAGLIRFGADKWYALGIFLMVAGVVFRWYAIHTLGQFFTRNVATQTAHRLVQVGPYRWIRHPSYTGTLITLVGFGLALGSWISLAVTLVGGVIGLLYRMSVEERALCQALGDEYRAYMRRTRRIVPFIW